jgi:hypothetical protein
VATVVAPFPARAGSAIRFPSPADAAQLPSASQLLGTKPGAFPNKAPGPVSGAEHVTIAVDPNGVARAIRVDQTLILHGLGDFTIEVPGPATAVTGVGDSQPGLRLGSVIWEGFSPGKKVLRAIVDMDTSAPSFRTLPLAVSVRALYGGRVVTSGTIDGPVTLDVEIANRTAAPRATSIGAADRVQLAMMLERMRALLASGKIPIAGQDGIPTSITASGPIQQETVAVDVPMRIAGAIEADGFSTSHSTRIDAVLPSAAHSDGTLRMLIDGTASHLTLPLRFRIDAEATTPDAATLRPTDATWAQSLARASAPRLRDATMLAATTLWEVLRRPDAEAYLSNPLGGASSASFTYTAYIAPAAPAGPARERVRPVALAIASLLMLLALCGAVVVWRRN